MAKIPVYSTSAAPTERTGMVSYRARFDSTPVVKATLANAEAFQTLTSTVGDFFARRATAERELAASQALLAAEVAMEQTVAELARSQKPFDVFGSDTSKPDNFMGAVEDIRQQHSADLSPSARKLFTTKFNPLILQYTAKLRPKIDKRINAGLIDNFTLTALDAETSFGDPDGDIKEYKIGMTKLANIGLALVKDQRITLEAFENRITGTVEKIAENSLANLLMRSDDPISLAISLQEGDEAEINKLSKGNAGYTMFALAKVTDTGKRLSIINSAVDNALKVWDREEKFRNAKNKKIKEQNDGDYNSIFSDRIAQDAKKKIFDRLDNSNFMTKKMRDTADAFINNELVFAEQDDGNVVIDLEQKLAKKLLTVGDIVGNAEEMTRERFQSFMSKVNTLRSQAVTDAMKIAKFKFKYSEEQGADIEPYETAARSAYYNSQFRIMQFEMENADASASQIRSEMMAILVDEQQAFVPILEAELIELLNKMSRKIDFPKVNGKYDYSRVGEAVANYLRGGEDRRVDQNLKEVNYYLDMIRKVTDE